VTGWQRWTWSLFRIPLYMITYPMAVVGLSQFAQYAETDRTRAIQNYKAVLSLGNTRPLPELFRLTGVDFPFTHEAVEAAAQFVIQSWQMNNP
jgi:oligoendopeptidase F